MTLTGIKLSLFGVALILGGMMAANFRINMGLGMGAIGLVLTFAAFFVGDSLTANPPSAEPDSQGDTGDAPPPTS